MDTCSTNPNNCVLALEEDVLESRLNCSKLRIQMLACIGSRVFEHVGCLYDLHRSPTSDLICESDSCLLYVDPWGLQLAIRVSRVSRGITCWRFFCKKLIDAILTISQLFDGCCLQHSKRVGSQTWSANKAVQLKPKGLLAYGTFHRPDLGALPKLPQLNPL